MAEIPCFVQHTTQSMITGVNIDKVVQDLFKVSKPLLEQINCHTSRDATSSLIMMPLSKVRMAIVSNSVVCSRHT